MIKSASFTFIPQYGRSPMDLNRIAGLLAQKDFVKFCDENEGISLDVTLEHSAVKSQKMKLYKYLHGPLVSAVMEAMRTTGNIVDKADCLLEMKCLFLKDLWINKKGETHAIILSLSDVSKDRLTLFVKDVIMYLEQEYGVEAPDSEYYKNLKLKAE